MSTAPALTAPEGDRQSHREIVTVWLKAEMARQLDEQGTISQPALAQRAIRHFGQEPGFLRAFAEECLYNMARQVVGDQARVTRRPYHQQRGGEVPILSIAGGAVTQEHLDRQAERFRQRFKWDRWVEHVAPGRDVRLMDMTSADLLSAAALRQQSAATAGVFAALWRRLASEIGTHDQVSSRFTSADIQRLYDEITG